MVSPRSARDDEDDASRKVGVALTALGLLVFGAGRYLVVRGRDERQERALVDGFMTFLKGLTTMALGMGAGPTSRRRGRRS